MYVKTKERNETQRKTKGRHSTVDKLIHFHLLKKLSINFPFFSIDHLKLIMVHRNNPKSTGEQQEHLMGKGIKEDKLL